LLTLLVDEDDLAAGFDELGGGDETGQPGSHDDDISIHAGNCVVRRSRAATWPELDLSQPDDELPIRS
jgi:hypothetical protein